MRLLLRLGGRSLVIAMLLGCQTDDVEFGPPGGLRARREGNTKNDACPIDPAADGSVCPDWTTEIFPLFDETGPYGCGLANCHGQAPGSAGLFIKAGDPTAAYTNMSAFKNAGRPYIGPPDEAYLLCNLSPDPDVKIGSLMPLVGGNVEGLVLGDDLIALGNWVLCGSPQ
jgi:hypothetical protein